MPFREAHGVVAGLVREAVESGRPLRRGGACRRSARTPRSAARALVVAGVEGLRGRDGAARASASSSRACPRAAVSRPRASTTARCSRSRPTCIGCVVRHGDTAGRHRRDRGLPRVRARLARVRRADGAHRAAVRAARDRLRLPLLRHPRAAQRRLRPRRLGRRGADPRAGAARRHRADARAPARRARRASCATGPGKLTQALGIGLELNRQLAARRADPHRAARARLGGAGARSSAGASGSRRPSTSTGASARRGNRYVSRPWPPRAGARSAA